MHRGEFLDRRIADREINPIHQREGAEIIRLIMDDLRMSTREDREGATRADNVNRLP